MEKFQVTFHVLISHVETYFLENLFLVSWFCLNILRLRIGARILWELGAGVSSIFLLPQPTTYTTRQSKLCGFCIYHIWIYWTWWLRWSPGGPLVVTKWSPSGQQVVTKWSLKSGCHKLSENIWFAWSNTCCKGEKVRCHACARTHGRKPDMWK